MLLVAAGGSWYAGYPGSSWLTGPGEARHPAVYVGEHACAACHPAAAEAWRGSHHARAMQPATEAAVLGDFDRARFTYAGVTTTFVRRDGKFVVRTDGPDGTLHDYDVAYTFGVAPLQQYLVDFPGGRKQALGIAWDSRPKTEGGQRWFHLYPGQNVTYRDELHWTAPSQNWNHVCAECHSTNVRKGYDTATRRFDTTYSEVNVACEACHGPGSNHVAWARKDQGGRRVERKGLMVAFDGRKGAAWSARDGTGTAVRTPPPGGFAEEVAACGRCHARRSQFGDDSVPGRPLADTHRVALLEEPLYHVDGQIRDEVYEYGSFRQSAMFRAGVTCSDCHDPHSGKLRAAGQEVCLRCHAVQKYGAPAHHHHAAGSAGSDCLGCHMPTTTYMLIHARRDHSLRVPRPDLTVSLGVPNACTRCHPDRPAEWAARQVEAAYGRAARGYQRYAEALAAAAIGRPGSAGALRALVADAAQPAIARASALARLGGVADPGAREAAGSAAKDADPLVRRAAASALDGADATVRVEIVAPLLDDPVRSVRMEAARVLVGAREQLAPPQRAALERGLAEYVAGERLNADRPESHLNLGLLRAAQGDHREAEVEMQAALGLNPRFVPAAVNLADFYRATGRDADGERVLRDAIAREPRAAAVHHALGLLLVRQKRAAHALAELEAAARLDPDSARYGYVYAVALHDAGRSTRALDALARVLARHPWDRDALTAAGTKRGSSASAARSSASARSGSRRAAWSKPRFRWDSGRSALNCSPAMYSVRPRASASRCAWV